VAWEAPRNRKDAEEDTDIPEVEDVVHGRSTAVRLDCRAEEDTSEVDLDPHFLSREKDCLLAWYILYSCDLWGFLA